MVGIVCCTGAEAEHDVITSALPLRAQTMRGIPHQRIEPIDPAGTLAKNLSQPVVSFHMAKFMRENHAASFQRPLRRVCGKQNDRPQDSPRHWRDELSAYPKTYRNRHAELALKFAVESLPFSSHRDGVPLRTMKLPHGEKPSHEHDKRPKSPGE